MKMDSPRGWAQSDVILDRGEIGIEVNIDGDRLKIGDGKNVWAALPELKAVPKSVSSLIDWIETISVVLMGQQFCGAKNRQIIATALEKLQNDVGKYTDGISSGSELKPAVFSAGPKNAELRDQFAMAAFSACHKAMLDGCSRTGYPHDWQAAIAREAYAFADLMVSARSAGTPFHDNCAGSNNPEIPCRPVEKHDVHCARDNYPEIPGSSTNLDAVPEARADLPDERPPNAVSANGGTPGVASRDGSGTGNTLLDEKAKEAITRIAQHAEVFGLREHAATLRKLLERMGDGDEN